MEKSLGCLRLGVVNEEIQFRARVYLHAGISVSAAHNLGNS